MQRRLWPLVLVLFVGCLDSRSDDPTPEDGDPDANPSDADTNEPAPPDTAPDVSVADSAPPWPLDAIPPAPEVSPVTSSCPDWEDASPLGPRGISVVAALADDDVLSLSGAFVWHWDGVTHRAAPIVLEGSPGPTPCEPLFWSDLHREGELWWATTHDGEVWHGRLLSTLSRRDLFEGRALAVSGTSPSDVWVAGDGGLAHFDGQTWTTRVLDARFTVTDVHAISPDLVWVTATWSETETLAGPSRLYRSVRTDTGLEFEVAHELTGDLRSVWAHGTEAWVVGRSAEGDGRTVFAHFDGQTWSPLTPPPLYELHELTGHFGDAVELWVWGVGTLYHWRDEAWREVLFGDLGTGFGTHSLSSTGPGRAWAENGHNLIHITPQRVGMLRGACCHLFDLEAASPDELWFTGERGLLMHHDGATYTMDESLFESLELDPEHRFPLPAMFGLWRSPASRDAASGPPTTWLWAVGHDGKTAQVRRREVPLGARPTDLTEPWITVTVPPPARDAKLLDIWGADLEHLWVVGLIGEADHQPAEGVLLEWDGETLRPADLERPTPSTPIGGLRVVTGTAANDVWAVGRGDALHHFDGSRWSTYRLPFPLNLNDATAVAPGLLFATGAPDTFDQGYYFGVAIEVDLARSEPVQLLRFLDDEPLMASWRSRSSLNGVAVDSQGNLWLGDDKTWDRVARWSEFLPPTEGRIVHDGHHLWLLLIDGQALRSPASVVWKP